MAIFGAGCGAEPSFRGGLYSTIVMGKNNGYYLLRPEDMKALM